MTETEAMKILQDRYDCEIRRNDWGVHIYYKSIYMLISFEEDIQKWGKGNMWNGSRQIWSTGEFKESRKLTMEQLMNVLDEHIPVKEQIGLGI